MKPGLTAVVIMYKNIKSLCCTREPNIILYISYNPILKLRKDLVGEKKCTWFNYEIKRKST